jgi:ribonuclease P protein component
MLPVKNRLIGNLSYDKAKKKGKMYQSDSFGILVRDRKDNNPSKFGIIVSTKISKKAVDRNRIKRMLREAIKESLDKIEDGKDIVVLSRKGLLNIDKRDLESEFSRILKEAKLI